MTNDYSSEVLKINTFLKKIFSYSGEIEIKNAVGNIFEKSLFRDNYIFAVYEYQNPELPEHWPVRGVNCLISKEFSSEQIEFIKNAFAYWFTYPVPDQDQIMIDESFIRPRDRSLAHPYESSLYLLYDSRDSDFTRVEKELFVCQVGLHCSLMVNKRNFGGSNPGTDISIMPKKINNLIIINHFSKAPENGANWTVGKGARNIHGTIGINEISLNALAIGSTSDYPLSESREHWAGIILHELLHTIGYTHDPSGQGSIYEKAFMIQYENSYRRIHEFDAMNNKRFYCHENCCD